MAYQSTTNAPFDIDTEQGKAALVQMIRDMPTTIQAGLLSSLAVMMAANGAFDDDAGGDAQ